MNLWCRGILINQYPLPGIMNLNTYSSEAQELLFTVITSIYTASGQKQLLIPFQKDIPTGCCCVNPHYWNVPCYWAAPQFHLYHPLWWGRWTPEVCLWVCPMHYWCCTIMINCIRQQKFHKNLVWPRKTGWLIAVQLQFGITVSWKNIPRVKEHPPPPQFWFSFLQRSKFTLWDGIAHLRMDVGSGPHTCSFSLTIDQIVSVRAVEPALSSLPGMAYQRLYRLFATNQNLAEWSYCTLETTQASFNLCSSKPQPLGGELQMLTDDV